MVDKPLERQSARLFQGAHISLGGIKNLDRALIDYRPEEIAYIVGYYMFQNAEAGLSPDGNIYRGSIGYVIRQSWPMQDEPPKQVIKKISFHLRQNGFRAVGAGQQFLGWLVPHDLSGWIEPQERKVVIEPEQVVIVNPVKTMWACQFGCLGKEGSLTFESQFARDKHHEIVHDVVTHRAPEEGADVNQQGNPTITCEICGKSDIKSVQGLGIHKRYVHGIEGKDSKHPIKDGVLRAEPKKQEAAMATVQTELPVVSEVTKEEKVWKCPECGMEFSSSVKMASHIGHEHRNFDWTCPTCGKTMKYAGKGGHMAAHRVSIVQQIALDAVKDHPGQHPAEYATSLGISNNSMSRLGMQLKKRGLLKVVGQTQGTRYYPETNGKKVRGRKVASSNPSKPIATATVPNPAEPEKKKSGFRKQSVTSITSSDVKKVVLIGEDVLIEDGEVYKITRTKVS